MVDSALIRSRFALLSPHLNERGRRLFAASEARAAGHGGIVTESLDRRHQPEPTEHANMFTVGDYLFDSTLNGVLDSAEYVAAWLSAQMADKPEGEA